MITPRLFQTLFLLLASTFTSLAALTPAPPFSSHMVLQRDRAIPVWGTHTPGAEVSVQMADQVVITQTDDAGNWKVSFPAMPAGGSYTLSISSANELVAMQNITMGDIWVCSGQSNMAWSVVRSANADEEIAAANYPDIRLLQIARKTSAEPVDSFEATWTPCTPESIPNFSAVGYFFGREVHLKTGVPIGLISSNWGGTPAEAWTTLEALGDNPDFAPLLKRRDTYLATANVPNIKEKTAAAKTAAERWDKKFADLAATPQAPDPLWSRTQPDPSDWKEIAVPGKCEPFDQFDGVIWFRKEIALSDVDVSKAATLNLGAIDDFDAAWVNGKLVGQTDASVTNAYRTNRSYSIDPGLLKPGKNIILVRVVDRFAGGGFSGSAQSINLQLAESTPISLAGTWTFHVEQNLGTRPNIPSTRPHNIAGMLYNGMIAPLIEFPIRGVIWYQGESNAGRAEQYETLFPAMIESWRTAWNQGDFPFYFVQLANFKERNEEPVNDAWAELRDAQTQTLQLPNTGMAVAIDIGEANDIHPKNKQEVGRRLALWALAEDYGITEPKGSLASLPLIGKFFQQPLTHSGPLYQEYQVEENSVVIEFDHVAKGLQVLDGDELQGFAIAGDDKAFVWANARIDGTHVIVSHPDITSPVAVRYGWSINPEVNLGNSADLPASPFRTDDWPGITDGKK
jgi:sialate O-acetylesterase